MMKFMKHKSNLYVVVLASKMLRYSTKGYIFLSLNYNMETLSSHSIATEYTTKSNFMSALLCFWIFHYSKRYQQEISISISSAMENYCFRSGRVGFPTLSIILHVLLYEIAHWDLFNGFWHGELWPQAICPFLHSSSLQLEGTFAILLSHRPSFTLFSLHSD